MHMSEFKLAAEPVDAMETDVLEELYDEVVSDKLLPLISDGISDAMDNYDSE